MALCWWELKHENLVSNKLIRWKWWVIVAVNLCNWKEEAWKISGLQRSRWSPDIFQASSFQLLKFIKFTAMITLHFHLQPQYNMNFIYIFHKLMRVKFFPALILTSLWRRAIARNVSFLIVLRWYQFNSRNVRSNCKKTKLHFQLTSTLLSLSC